MSEIYEVMAEESRQSYFHLENMIMSLDSKAFGVITADALLFSVFTYVIDKSNTLFYIAPALIIVSFVLLLASVWRRAYQIQTGDEVIKKYGRLESKLALSQLAANYADLESKLSKIYNKKFGWFLAGLILMVISMAMELIVFGYAIFDP
jgi:hypothetical protein